MITLRPVAAADGAFILEVYASSRADELAVVPWSEDDKRHFVESQSRAQATDYERRFPASDHCVVVVDDVPVGRMWVGRSDDEIRLLDVTILPEHRGRGIGRVLVERLIEEAGASGAPLRHMVLKSNADALRFYERLGFEVVEGSEMYVLMEWTAGGRRPVDSGPATPSG